MPDISFHLANLFLEPCDLSHQLLAHLHVVASSLEIDYADYDDRIDADTAADAVDDADADDADVRLGQLMLMLMLGDPIGGN